MMFALKPRWKKLIVTFVTETVGSEMCCMLAGGSSEDWKLGSDHKSNPTCHCVSFCAGFPSCTPRGVTNESGRECHCVSDAIPALHFSPSTHSSERRWRAAIAVSVTEESVLTYRHSQALRNKLMTMEMTLTDIFKAALISLSSQTVTNFFFSVPVHHF